MLMLYIPVNNLQTCRTGLDKLIFECKFVIFSYQSVLTYVLIAQNNRTHSICFCWGNFFLYALFTKVLHDVRMMSRLPCMQGDRKSSQYDLIFVYSCILASSPQQTTRTRSRWGAISNPHANFLTPSTPKSHPWGPRHSVWYVFIYICQNTHKVWYKILCNWSLMTFWPVPNAPGGWAQKLFCCTPHPCE